MKIIKDFLIDELSLKVRSNAPYHLELSNLGDGFGRIEPSELIFDDEILRQWGVAHYLDLAGKALRCTFQSREPELIATGHHKDSIDWSPVDSQDLGIVGIRREEETSFLHGIPPKTFNRVNHLLKLQSFGGGDGIHLSPLPCPFYEFYIMLTEAEYRECILLTPTSVVKVSFEVISLSEN